jgi:hypothetical protein
MGNGEWGTGNGEWGMGNGERGTGNVLAIVGLGAVDVNRRWDGLARPVCRACLHGACPRSRVYFRNGMLAGRFRSSSERRRPRQIDVLRNRDSPGNTTILVPGKRARRPALHSASRSVKTFYQPTHGPAEAATDGRWNRGSVSVPQVHIAGGTHDGDFNRCAIPSVCRAGPFRIRSLRSAGA